MKMISPPNFVALAEQFDLPDVDAIVLMGSFARGNATRYSDIDLVRFTNDGVQVPLSGAGSYLIEQRLLNVSDVTPEQSARWFTEPEEASENIFGLKNARVLIAKSDRFNELQSRAKRMIFDDALQAKAYHWAGEQLIGWIEEVLKGLTGIQANDTSRLLHARHGCSWGLLRVMQVARGVFIQSDNMVLEQVTTAVGLDGEWTRLLFTAFGIEDSSGNAPTLKAQVIAGLDLYRETVRLLQANLSPAHVPLLEYAVSLIDEQLG